MRRVIPVLSCLVGVQMFLVGCGADASKPEAKGHSSTTGSANKGSEKEVATKGGHDHSGWWCSEHGVPEEVCALCSSKVAAEFQKKGDWCKDHDRPDSQCFKCHPELEEKFAAQYEAKFGTKPPKTEVN